MFAVVLIICFLPALLVFGFVQLYKEKLAKDPTKKQLTAYVAQYTGIVIVIAIVTVALSQLTK